MKSPVNIKNPSTPAADGPKLELLYRIRAISDSDVFACAKCSFKGFTFEIGLQGHDVKSVEFPHSLDVSHEDRVVIRAAAQLALRQWIADGEFDGPITSGEARVIGISGSEERNFDPVYTVRILLHGFQFDVEVSAAGARAKGISLDADGELTAHQAATDALRRYFDEVREQWFKREWEMVEHKRHKMGGLP